MRRREEPIDAVASAPDRGITRRVTELYARVLSPTQVLMAAEGVQQLEADVQGMWDQRARLRIRGACGKTGCHAQRGNRKNAQTQTHFKYRTINLPHHRTGSCVRAIL